MRSLIHAVPNSQPDLSDWLKLLQLAVESVRFGVVQLVIHDGKVVQIEKTEKLRIEQH